MKFAHIADCHIGGWREEKLKILNLKAFSMAADRCIKERVDFAVISGDLFNTSVPSLDCLKAAVTKLRQLKENGIPIYIIAGSHDYSPSGKTIIDILEEAGLLINISKASVNNGKISLIPTRDEKTGTILAGIPGRKGMLDKSYYEAIDRESLLEITDSESYKIFAFHTAITELKPKDLSEIESTSLSMLPKGFDYYAGGHVHCISTLEEKDCIISFPGPTFPNNFKELEELGKGGMNIVTDGKLECLEINAANVISIKYDCSEKTPEEAAQGIIGEASKKDVDGPIVLLRLFGKLKSGKPSDIDYKKVMEYLYNNNAYFVMRNTAKLEAKEFEEIKVEKSSTEEIEEKLIEEHAGDKLKEKALIKELMMVFSNEKKEGEKSADYEKRIITEARKAINHE